jgi:6-pyruvoyltetrahydropterin/6-carboxytetrahydropterin synthase
MTTIEINKEAMHFSAAHFTLFSATERENLHGHNFQVEATLDGEVGDDGLCFDYNVIKTKLKSLCDALDERVLLPERSPHLRLTEENGYLIALFAGERIPFLPRDVKTLPVRNVTVEELAQWFIDTLTRDKEILALPIARMTLRCSSGPGQWASANWSRP